MPKLRPGGLLLLKYSNRWVWDICMEDSRTVAVGFELAKYGHFSKQKWLVILYVLAKDRGENQETEKENACLLCRFLSFKTKKKILYISFVGLFLSMKYKQIYLLSIRYVKLN